MLAQFKGLFREVQQKSKRGWNFAGLGSLDHVVGSTISQSLDCARRLVAPTGYEAASIHYKKIRYVVRTVVLVHNGSLGIVSHSAGPHQMNRHCDFLHRPSPLFLRASSLQQLERPLAEKRHVLQVVRMIPVGDSNGRLPPASLTSGSRDTVLVSIGRDVRCANTLRVRV